MTRAYSVWAKAGYWERQSTTKYTAQFTYVLRANSASGAFFSPRSPPWKTNASITLHRVQSQKWTYLVATAIVIAAILRDLILRLTFHVSAERFIKHTALWEWIVGAVTVLVEVSRTRPHAVELPTACGCARVPRQYPYNYCLQRSVDHAWIPMQSYKAPTGDVNEHYSCIVHSGYQWAIPNSTYLALVSVYVFT